MAKFKVNEKHQAVVFRIMGMPPFVLRRLCLLVIIEIMSTFSIAKASSDAIEFNTDTLDVSDKKNIDLSRFSHAGYIMPGRYVMTVKFGENEIQDQPIDWMADKNDASKSIPCITPDLVNRIGLTDDAKKQIKWSQEKQCLDFSSIKGFQAQGDLGSSTVTLNIPQIYLEYRTKSWDPPSLWDNGVSGVLFDYYQNLQTIHTEGDGDTNSVSGNGTLGSNFGPWRLRADWQNNFTNNSDGSSVSNWDWSRYYAYRALPTIGAKLTLGENSLYSDIFDSFSFTGVNLSSDDNMLPPNLRGYAPEVSGVAKTNAKVTISQQGRVLQITQVAAGPFRIQDLNSMVSGQLDVKVEEQDGTTQNFTVNTATIPYLTRPGQVRYKTAIGRPSDVSHHVTGPTFATGEASWGINNGWSLYGGGIGSGDYDALALGIGRDLFVFGAVSFDVTESMARLPYEDDTLKGKSYRVSYSKLFDTTGSEVTFAGYRFSEENYMSMGDYLDALDDGERDGASKEMYTVTFSQQISDYGLSAYVNYSHQTYWDQQDEDRYTLTIAQNFDMGRFRNISLSATAYTNTYDDEKDNGMYLSLSIPWGDGGLISYENSVAGGEHSDQVSYYDRVNERNDYKITTGTSDNHEMMSGYFNHEADIAQINTNATYKNANYSSLSMSLQGGMTATTKGVALHRTGMAGGTRVMVDTGDVAEVPVNTYGANTRTNMFGKAVVGDVSSYYRNTLKIDLDALPDNVEPVHSVAQATLTEGAIGYRKFDVISGMKAMVAFRLNDGSYPPFGAVVVNSEDQNVGIVGDDGEAYLSGMQPNGIMTLQWNGTETCKVQLPASLQKNMNQMLLLPCHATIEKK